MINISTYEQRVKNAQAQKNSSKYADRLKAELTKPEWANELQKISTGIFGVTTEKGFEESERKLKDLFDRIFEVITAPGLDDFMGWIESMSRDKTNIQDLRTFLASNYVTYGSIIDKIIETKDKYISDDDTLLFSSLISKFDKQLRTKIKDFVSKKEDYEKGADGFLTRILEELQGINAIDAIGFHDQRELYSDEQKKVLSMNFYSDIINDIITSCQTASIVEEAKKSKLYDVVSNRISKAKASINLLYTTNIADELDEVLKKTFLRYRKKMTDTTGDIYTHLKSFLDNQWNDISSNYSTIKYFYNQKKLSFDETLWSQFEKSAEIDALVQKYDALKDSSILPILGNITIDDLAGKLKEQADNIKGLDKKASDCRKELYTFFQNFVDDYTNKKRPMLEKLLAKNEKLKDNYNLIFSNNGFLKALSNGIDSFLSEDGYVLKALATPMKAIPSMIVKMENAKNAFANAFKDSGLKEEIEWIDSLNPDNPFTKETFDEGKLMKLLENGLITISFTKTY